MKICAVYGTERKGCTWHIAREILSRLPEAEVTEFFLPQDCPECCISCFRCFNEENHCYYSAGARTILAAMLASDIILLTSPVYALHLTGQMKTFLDHYACTWMVHKPNGEMFGKQGVVIASASGPVYRAALREMKDSLDFWGVAHTYKLGFTLMEISWDRLSPKLKRKISRQAERTAAKLRRGVPGPGLKTRCLFYAMRLAQKYIWRDSPDAGWWRSHGWLDRERPWKSTGAAPRRGGKREDTP